MADTNLADWTKQVSAAGMALDKDFGKAMTKSYTKVVIFNKLLGPFYNLWLKLKTGIGAVLAPMKGLLVPLGIMEKTVDGIRMSFLGMIGILFTVISVFAYLTSSVGSAGGGTGELVSALSGLKDILIGVIQQIMAFDFGPAIEMAKSVLTEFGTFFVSVVTLMVEILTWWISTWLSVVEAMYDHGVFHALLAVFMGIWAGISAIFGSFQKAFEDLGITGGSVTSSLTSAFNKFGSFLVDSGIVDFIVLFIETLGLLFEVAGVIFGKLIELVVYLAVEIGGALGDASAGGAFMTFLGLIEGVITGIISIFTGLLSWMNTFLNDLLYIFTAENPFDALAEVAGNKVDWIINKMVGIKDAIFEFITPPIEAVGNAFSTMLDGAGDAIQFAIDGIVGIFEGFLDAVQEIFDMIPDFGDVVGGVSDFVGSIGGSIGGIFSGSGGGVATGPTSGYPAILHGTEAVVPLPDGRSIPVAIEGEGMGGGGTTNITNDNTLNENTVNITVSGANGNPQDIAKAVSKEVQRVFKSRSRSGGYGRGI